MRRNGAVFAVTVAACAEQQHSGQGNPATHRMHHDRTRKVVELVARDFFQPSLETKMLVPGDAFEEGVNKAHDDGCCDQLGPKACAFGNAARDDGGNGGGKREQEKELDQVIAVFVSQCFSAHHEAGAVGHAITNGEIGHGRDTKVDQDFDQRIDLVFLANGAEL